MQPDPESAHPPLAKDYERTSVASGVQAVSCSAFEVALTFLMPDPRTLVAAAEWGVRGRLPPAFELSW